MAVSGMYVYCTQTLHRLAVSGGWTATLGWVRGVLHCWGGTDWEYARPPLVRMGSGVRAWNWILDAVGESTG